MSKISSSARKLEQEALDVSEITSALGDVRRHLAGEIKLRRDVLKPVEQAAQALKDPHRNAVALSEAVAALEIPSPDLALPDVFTTLLVDLRALADANLSELEFTFARDLRAAFKERGIELTGTPTELIADLFLIKVDIRRKQVEISFSRQPVTGKKIKLDTDQTLSAYERARREICERKVDYDALLREIYEAYGRTLKFAGKQTGTRMSIVDCYRELVIVRQPLSFRKTPSKLSFVDYPKTHFAYDMLQLRRKHQLTVDGQRLNLGTATIDVGSDTARAMFLANSATEGQFIKDLYFAPEK